MRRTAYLMLLLPLTACGGSAAAGALATRADSAGITIVTNTDPSWRDGDGWQIDATPRLEIGPTETDDPHYDFLRVFSGTILPTGEIAVVVSASREIRVFDAAGQWLRNIGRDGEGPGEMRGPGFMTRVGDTLFVPDGQLGRMSAFSTDGAFLGSWRYPSAEGSGRVAPSHRLADGSWVASGGVSFGSGGMPSEGLMRMPMAYFRLDAGLESVLDTIVETPGSEMVIASSRASADGGGAVRTMMFIAPPPLGRSTPMTAAGEQVIWGDNASPQLQIHAGDGTLHTILRWAAPAIPVDAALIERVKQAALARAEGNATFQERIEGQYANPSPAPVVPYFTDVRRDAEGALWVQEYLIVPTDTVHFRIFDRDGQYLGRRSLPPRHRVIEIGTDHILTVWQDDDDLEYLRVYRLRR
ncbi:MAG: hypothetical protein ABR551_09505 [Gemmatimonadales bacterium]